MRVLGIDPGRGGGMAIVRGGKLLAHTRMPTLKVRDKNVLAAGVANYWVKRNRPDVAVIEAAHAMPRQGVTSSFGFGRITGSIEAVCMIHAKCVWVSPNVWKKHHCLTSSKQDSLDLAAWHWHLHGHPDWTVKANEGIAEAALIAQWWIDKETEKALSPPN